MTPLLEALKNSVLITGLVMIMMLLIEYINIHSHGKSFEKLKKSPKKQVLLAALLGLVPGCIGGFAVVSLFTHKLLSFGALVAMMIASSGDEAFILMALIPKTAIILFIILFVIGVTVGIVVDKFYKKDVAPFEPEHYALHDNCCSEKQVTNTPIFGAKIRDNFKKISRERLLIMGGIAIFILAVVAGILEHDHNHGVADSHTTTDSQIVTHSHTNEDAHLSELQSTEAEKKSCIQDELAENTSVSQTDSEHKHDENCTDHNHNEAIDSHNHGSFDILNERWLNLIFAGVSLLTLLLTAKANEHFIKEHIWNHVVKKHLKSIFLWTLGVLMVIHFGMQFLHIDEWIAQNIFIMILLAVLIGIIPESGPHMVFITLFAGGFIPFSVLLASSIVQDGHTALPLLAESKSSFVKSKAINVVVGLTVGVLLHLFGL